MSHVPLNIPDIKAIVFDLDNTLVSSDMDFRWLREQIGCPLNQDLLSYVDDLICPNQQQDAHAKILEHELEDAQHSTPMPGCHDLLSFIKDNHLKTGIITRNCQQAAKQKVSHNNLAITDIITREQFPPKPAPDSLVFLADQWNLERHQVLYVGDYLYDLQAAFNADMPSCLVTHAEPNNFESHASIVVNHLTELQRAFAHHYQ
ncbi:HAD family hydrolase [Vibrio sp. RE86]|uniref:HAD family hydrolase n=1 Tax=Vibrio sp. RE86 TaxID=2607605 RepID=UPI0014935B75|nr:HAD family hydrolase [Vibrio sp. RE86]NOH79839.1 HAD family hydrolase [Vibrio sp. RE86]